MRDSVLKVLGHALRRRVTQGLIVLAMALTSLAAPAAAQAPESGPSIWRLQDENNTVWIFGSVHVLPPGLPWRRPAVDAALNQAEIVYFEIVFTRENLAEMDLWTTMLGSNPDGERLSDHFGPTTRKRLSAVIASLGFQRSDFEWMRPWLAQSELEYALYEAEGATWEHGVDTILEADAIAAGKELRSLDTPEQLIRAFADAPLEAQIEVMEQSLRLFDQSPEFGAELDAIWLSGDADRMEALYVASTIGYPPIFDQLLLRDRNARWTDEIAGLMAGDRDALIVVGAFHMVGPDSLILMLEERGFTVERF